MCSLTHVVQGSWAGFSLAPARDTRAQGAQPIMYATKVFREVSTRQDMKLFRSPGDSTEVLSLSISPDDRYCVCGCEDGSVRVWEVDKFVQVLADEIPTKAQTDEVKVFQTLQYHGDSAVNIVRFAHGTGMLASGDGLGKVYILKDLKLKPELILDLYSDALPEGLEDILPRKADDDVDSVVDLSWSRDNKLLAIAGLNHKVLIYDLLAKQFVLGLGQFAGHVKGLSFDPTGNLLTVVSGTVVDVYQYETAADGKFRVGNVQTLPKLLQKSLATSQFSRFNWSPNGNLMAIPNGTRETGKATNRAVSTPVSSVINFTPSNLTHAYSLSNVSVIAMLSPLNSFKTLFSLVGHKFSSIEVSQFNPKLFKVLDSEVKTNELNVEIKNSRYFSVVATGGVDKTLAVWSTMVEKPIFIGTQFAKNTITDLAWTHGGTGLFVVSLDGSVTLVKFDVLELGLPATEQEYLLSLKEVSNGIKKLEPEKVAKIEPKKEDPKKPVVAKPSTLTAKKPVKKRIVPKLVSNSSTASNGTAATASSSKSVSSEYSAPSKIVSKGMANTVSKRQKEKEPEDESKNKKPKLSSYEPVEFLNTTIVNPDTAFARLRLAVPKSALHIAYASPLEPALVLNVKNGSGNEQKPTRISLNQKPEGFSEDKGKEVFVDFIPKLVNLVVASEKSFWAVSCLDGTLIIYSITGKRIFPPMVLGSALSFLEAKGDFLMAVTAIGDLYVWNITEKKIWFKPINLYSLFEPFAKYQDDLIVKGDSMTLCSITSTGIPLATLSNGNGYLYNKDMASWCVVSDSWWAFGSQYWDSIGDSKATSVISILEFKTNEELFKKRRNTLLTKISKIMLMKHGYENLETSISLTHLENRILISEMLRDSAEFKRLLITYCVRLCELASSNRLIEIFDNLVAAEKEPTVCGLDKRELLKEVILACANRREVQKILVHFGKEIGLILDQ